MSEHQQQEAGPALLGDARLARSLGTASCWMAVPAFILFSFALSGYGMRITATTFRYETPTVFVCFAIFISGLGLVFGLGSLNGNRPWRLRAVLGIALNAPVFVIGGAIAVALASPAREFWYHFFGP